MVVILKCVRKQLPTNRPVRPALLFIRFPASGGWRQIAGQGRD